MPGYDGGGGSSTPGGTGPTTIQQISDVDPVASLSSDKIISSEKPGDLGSLYLDKNRFLLLAESRRDNASFNGLATVNLRFRGHREANKFNLIMQKLVTICASLFLTLRSSNKTLITRESTDMYPTDTEIEELYHIREQITFKEWLLLKDDNKRWYL
jgi:hypothetical protein